MRLGIMQPYFLPYLGYFSLIKHTDSFILFDPVQFIRHGWIERNQILKPVSGRQYIAVPLQKYSRDTIIKDIKINNSTDWRDLIFRQLEHYRKRSPFYDITVEVLRTAFDIDTDSIVELNQNVLKKVCEYIDVRLNVGIFSEMNLKIEEAKAPDEWALNICKALGNIDEYWNPEGGMGFFDQNKYKTAGVKINFLKINLPVYSQRRAEFNPGLSIVDVMMFNDPKSINTMLDDYSLLQN